MNIRRGYGALKDAVENRGYVFFDEGEYNLNIIGIRSSDRDANTFNDRIYLAYRKDDERLAMPFHATTDPGTYYRTNPLREDGVAFLMPGQYRGLWALGLHQGRHPALVQRIKLEVARDNDRDTHLDPDTEFLISAEGLNLHSTTGHFGKVDKWSAGCQVIPCPVDFAIFMAIVKQSAKRYGDTFTYTLLEQRDLQ